MSVPSDEASARALLSWPEEFRVLCRFGLHDGMRVLDLGSGPGLIAAELLDRCPRTVLVGVDRAPSAREPTDRVAVRFRAVQAAADRLPFRSGSFDFVLARLVLQYVRDPVAAAREALAVLRPAGLLAVVDVDRELSYALDPPLPELDRLMARYDAWHRGRGGDRGVGGRLRAILVGAGAVDVQTETIRFESRSETAERYLDVLVGPRRVRELREAGYVTQADIEDFLTARGQWLVSPGRAVTRYLRMACGAAPANGLRSVSSP